MPCYGGQKEQISRDRAAQLVAETAERLGVGSKTKGCRVYLIYDPSGNKIGEIHEDYVHHFQTEEQVVADVEQIVTDWKAKNQI
jgi:hypothetical protein